MADEKPLHVRVAEALGLPTEPSQHAWDEAAEGYRACTRCNQSAGWNSPEPEWCASRYDTDWSATGPLIERLRIALTPIPYGGRILWRAHPHDFGDKTYLDVQHYTPLEAVCLAILALADAGRLPK